MRTVSSLLHATLMAFFILVVVTPASIQAQRPGGAQLNKSINGRNVGLVTEAYNSIQTTWFQTRDKIWQTTNASGQVVGTYKEMGRDEWSVYLQDNRLTKIQIDLWQKKVYDRTRGTEGDIIKASLRSSSTAPASAPGSGNWTAFTMDNKPYYLRSVGMPAERMNVYGNKAAVRANVKVNRALDELSQTFRFVSSSVPGVYLLKTEMGNMFLSVEHSRTADGTNIFLNNLLSGKANQQWYIEKNAQGHLRFRSALAPNTYLGIDHQYNIVLFNGEKGENMYFTAEPAAGKTPSTQTAGRTNLGFPNHTMFDNGLNDFGHNDGWSSIKHFRGVGDVNGDRIPDFIGCGTKDVFVGLMKKDLSLRKAKRGLPNNLAYNSGWRPNLHDRFIGDINNDGRADLVGFGSNSVMAALGKTDGTFTSAREILKDFVNSKGWTSERHFRTFGDVNGDGNLDVIGFGTAKVFVYLGNGDGTFKPDVITAHTSFTPKAGWSTSKHRRLVVDMNGDGRADIVGFGTNQVLMAEGRKNGTFGPEIPLLNDFGSAKGWVNDKHERAVGDVNGDGKMDIIGFGYHKVYIALGQGNNRYATVIEATGDFTTKMGWNGKDHTRLVADMNGDGKADLVGFGNRGIVIRLSRSEGSTMRFGHVLMPSGLLSDNRSNWMAKLKDDLSIKDITIPGTHDSGADYGCPDPAFNKYGKCQDWSIDKQLKQGVRYLDIRLNIEDGKLQNYHGRCDQREDFGSILKTITSFLAANPSEGILMRVKREDDEESGYKDRWDQYVAANASYFYKGTSIPTVAQLRGKIMVLDNVGDLADYKWNSMNVPGGGYKITDDNTINDRYVKQFNRMVACNNLGSRRSKIWIIAFNGNALDWNSLPEGASWGEEVGNFFSNVGNILGGVVQEEIGPDDVADEIVPKLTKAIGSPDYNRGSYGVVCLDFPTPKLLGLLIDTNNMESKRN
ncbi:phosphatidylinositol-specific phospholipase C domain-containing protein [Neolewinella agarilytica]|uniref:1-phosphatidylinositol phosphodiesterase n=1 Tax=Neolewinella agarilytica TaxID=478744 RepID=A0A1H9BE05_9BACT|nr:phosphatidylinositol-specific phospholipase C domain-containing protein [Neolewinella agarilytica]SEP86863.1 Phosphatidylinositol-specific phospholipase C, X domain [Neolewinella agarilytica]